MTLLYFFLPSAIPGHGRAG